MNNTEQSEKVNGGMTDFEKYLGRWLLWSDEDCCSKCVNRSVNTNGELCTNIEEHAADGSLIDDDICLQGIRAYFERFEEAHT